MNTDNAEDCAEEFQDAIQDLIRQTTRHLDGSGVIANWHVYAADQLLHMAEMVDQSALSLEYVPDDGEEDEEA